jgi:predicted branched-subunit amino acid permease
MSAATATTVPNGAARNNGTGAVHDLLAMVPSIGPFGVALGMSAPAVHIGAVPTIFGAGAIYAGSAQLTVMTLLSSAAGLLSVLAAAVLANSRLLLYGAALEPRFRLQPLWYRLLGAHFIIDVTYIAAMSRPELASPAAFRRYWSRIGLGLLVAWTSAVGLGVVIGPALPRLPHLGLVGYALFTAMVAPRLTSGPALVAAAVAAGAALATTSVYPSLAVPAGAAAGMVTGTVLHRSRR